MQLITVDEVFRACQEIASREKEGTSPGRAAYTYFADGMALGLVKRP